MSRKKFCLDRSRDLFLEIQPTFSRLRCKGFAFLLRIKFLCFWRLGHHWYNLLDYMAHRHKPEEFTRDIEDRQRNIVFPDTVQNEARVPKKNWRNLGNPAFNTSAKVAWATRRALRNSTQVSKH
jgi:hypothetical protein